MPDKEKDPARLVDIFNRLFQDTEHCVVKMGAKEPFYQASKGDEKAVIFAREDYFSSALHEIAHWTLAGKQRRQLDDFGYWYNPEGRTLEQQKQFEQVEVKPQAVEWLLSLACGHTFHLSADNLSQSIDASDTFKRNVFNRAKDYKINGLPARAQILFEALNLYYRIRQPVRLDYV